MINEDLLEQNALRWLSEIGYQTLCGYDIAPDGESPERDSYQQVFLIERLKTALNKINPELPATAIEDAVDQILRPPHVSLTHNNQAFHQWLVEGVPVQYRKENNEIKGDYVKLLDYENVKNNDFLAVNQFTVKGERDTHRPDIVVFINGIPLCVIELKNPVDESTDIWKAHNQLQKYKAGISNLFLSNLALIISDGINARIGSLTADRDRFSPWRYVSNEKDKPVVEFELESLIKGFLRPDLLLDYQQYFVVFEKTKKIAGYHQFHAVRRAIDSTLKASQSDSDKRCGVFWHTQGSGKSLSMCCYAGKLIVQPEMENPTIVVVTDRNDLDDQLFEDFANAKSLLKQTPIQVESREDLREKLGARPAGGIIFTTIQMFMPKEGETQFPCLSSRHNLVIIADECHRSHYGLKAKLNHQTGQYDYGYAKHLRDALPNGAFIGFTGTPIELSDKSTKNVFGDYISVYDVQQAEADQVIVPIHYESRLVELNLNQNELVELEDEINEMTEMEESNLNKEKLKSRWSRLTAIVGAEPRIKKIAQDIVHHFSDRQKVLDGKAMIVCMSREICVHLYNAIVALKPEWHNDDPEQGVIKIVMTGSSDDKPLLHPHIYNKTTRKNLEKRFKDDKDTFKIVIVRDMWLTGFNVPSLHTMYVDKPMQGHNLMQAITRVNRVFGEKQGGLVVDYIGIAQELRNAVKNYTDNHGSGEPIHYPDEAYAVFKEKLDICRGIMHGFDYENYLTNPLKLLPDAANHILTIEDGKKRFLDAVMALTKAYSICNTQDRVKVFTEEIAFLQAIRAVLIKYTVTPEKQSDAMREHVLRQLISKAIKAEGVIDIFKTIGADKPNLSILSEEFLQSVGNIKQKNLAVELLEKLLFDQVKSRSKNNIIQEKKFSERLKNTLNKYHARAIETAKVIEELIQVARDFKAASQQGEALGLNDDERAFYDALCENESAVRELKDETLKKIAIELTEKLRKCTTVDWQVRESVRANLRLLVKGILRKYKYPPDQQIQTTELVLKQAETLCENWS